MLMWACHTRHNDNVLNKPLVQQKVRRLLCLYHQGMQCLLKRNKITKGLKAQCGTMWSLI